MSMKRIFELSCKWVWKANKSAFCLSVYFLELVLLFQLSMFSACKKDQDTDTTGVNDTTKISFTEPAYDDDYAEYADKSNSSFWGPYNLHDPSIIHAGRYYYIFSTDVAYGPNGQCGIMWRRSKDLVKWQFMGWVFDGVPPLPLQFMQANQPGYKQLSIWAPYIIKVNDQYRLYYSVPGNDIQLACIALATSASPEGPWTDEGIVLSCKPGDSFNAIDPAVITDASTGRQWMSYGSYWTGIRIVELDPATGKKLNSSDQGKALAKRNTGLNAIEGSEILYNPELKMYYLFVSYDWLEDNYNVRVGRSSFPEGPYYDINGNDMAALGDNLPMITAQYKFANHSGWQGFGHCGLLRDSNTYFYVSQARLGANKYFMDLHIHQMVFTPSGWPVISPERYAKAPVVSITKDSLTGNWEHINLVKTTSKNESVNITLLADGSVTGLTGATWIFSDNVIKISIDGIEYQGAVFRDWDWENKRLTITYSAMSPKGYCIWGKKAD